MYEKTKHVVKKLHPKNVVATFPGFMRDEAISGKLILIAAVLALIAVNSPFQAAFDGFWHNTLSIGIDGWTLSMDFRHWINEASMAIFFLVVGLEIKRELVHGELQDRKKAILPIAAAVGGMIVPALFYVAINNQPELIQGWGIPIATDIAFAVAVLALLSRRVPASLKLFLLALAIADDIGAIFVIALFYAEIINYGYLALSAVILVTTFTFRKWFANKIALFMLAGAVLWVTTHLSGIHASIVGAAIGLIAPVALRPAGASVSKRLEEFFLPISTFAVLPLFALANAGVIISTQAFSNSASLSVMAGIIFGLTAGKVVGITAASWLMVKLGKASLPAGTN